MADQIIDSHEDPKTGKTTQAFLKDDGETYTKSLPAEPKKEQEPKK